MRLTRVALEREPVPAIWYILRPDRGLNDLDPAAAFCSAAAASAAAFSRARSAACWALAPLLSIAE